MSQRFASQPCGRAAEDAADDSVQEGVPYRGAGRWYTSDETFPRNGRGLRMSSRWGGEKLSDWCVGFLRESGLSCILMALDSSICTKRMDRKL